MSLMERIKFFNATAFDEVTMKWVIVTRLRCNKKNSEMYKKAFVTVSAKTSLVRTKI